MTRPPRLCFPLRKGVHLSLAAKLPSTEVLVTFCVSRINYPTPQSRSIGRINGRPCQPWRFIRSNPVLKRCSKISGVYYNIRTQAVIYLDLNHTVTGMLILSASSIEGYFFKEVLPSSHATGRDTLPIFDLGIARSLVCFPLFPLSVVEPSNSSIKVGLPMRFPLASSSDKFFSMPVEPGSPIHGLTKDYRVMVMLHCRQCIRLMYYYCTNPARAGR